MKKYKALFISDIHMSNALPHSKPTKDGKTDRLEDQLKMWRHVERVAEREDVMAVYVLGDLFDKFRVDAVTLTETTRALNRVSRIAPVKILGGNHDATSTEGGRFVCEAFGEMGNDLITYLQRGWHSPPEAPWLSFWSLPFCSTSVAKEALEGVPDRDGAVKVNLLHHSILGCGHEGWTCDVGLTPEEARANFDFTLSGHFHTPQRFGEDRRGLYLGAPYHWRFDDAERKAGFWVIEFDESGGWKRKLIGSKLPRFHATEWCEDIKGMKDWRPGDYIRIRVTATHADYLAQRSDLMAFIGDLVAEGYRAVPHHKPIYHHRMRTSSKVGASMKPDAMVRAYVSDPNVETKGLSESRLVSMGIEAFGAP